jgi:hypothetical protein
MKTQLLKSILLFYLLSSIFILHSNAQIVYTDVNPDTTIAMTAVSNTIKAYGLDLNNDGLTDFNLIATSHAGPFGNRSNYVKITPINSNKVIDYDTINNLPAPLAINSVIGNTGKWWNNDSNQILTGSAWLSFFGLWNSSADAYLGLKLMSGQNIYYGWAKLSVTVHGSSFTLKDYAYNSIPNQPILAGETSCTTPTVNLTQSGPLSFCTGDSVTFTANGTGYQYQWKKNGVNISGANSKKYVAKIAGTYKCKVTSSCGSITSSGKTITVPCRMTNENFAETSEHLSVFPNPASNSITIKFPSDESGEIQIVNLFGQIVYAKNLQGLNEAQIDVNKFSTGMYVIRWNSGENCERKTFSIVK